MTLPSANSAARAFDALTTTASRHLRVLSTTSSVAFALAYLLSPRPLRHPYLLYASSLVLGSQLAASDFLAPYLLTLGPSPSGAGSSAAAAAKKQQQKQKQREKLESAARARMEASYEVLGTPPSAGSSDAHSEAGSGGEEVEAGEDVNGEEVRAEVEGFLKKQVVRGAVAGVAFLLSVVGIWGDAVPAVYGQAVIIEV